MRSLNLDQLRALTEVATLGSFSAAARRLNLTQPAVSLQIRELEARWGLRLIERLGKKARATGPGRELIEHARRIARECEAAETAMRGLRDGWFGRVHIGATLTALMYDLPPVLKRLRAEHPQIEVVITNMPTRDTVEQIAQNTIDFGLVTLPVKSALLKATPLRAQRCVAILPAATPDVPDEVTPAYLARHPLVLEHERGAVHALAMQWLSKHLPLARPPMHVGIIEAAKLAVASGLGMSIVPDVAVAEHGADILVRPLKPALPCTLGLVERRNKPSEAAYDIVRSALLGLSTLRETGASKRRRKLPAAAAAASRKRLGEAGRSAGPHIVRRHSTSPPRDRV
ncbi:MAG TPA: LysR family transcriptional regulator [Stellaceae bacterium]|nr:LysR family transcriptional regulator [Stellaceae bacterium]